MSRGRSRTDQLSLSESRHQRLSSPSSSWTRTGRLSSRGSEAAGRHRRRLTTRWTPRRRRSGDDMWVVSVLHENMRHDAGRALCLCLWKNIKCLVDVDDCQRDPMCGRHVETWNETRMNNTCAHLATLQHVCVVIRSWSRVSSAKRDIRKPALVYHLGRQTSMTVPGKRLAKSIDNMTFLNQVCSRLQTLPRGFG